MSEEAAGPGSPEQRGGVRREHRRRRRRRHRRRAYIRSVYFLPSLATLGNAICGFGAIYVAALTPADVTSDPWTRWFLEHHYTAAAWLIFVAMIFDALDGRLARFARHTTDFGGQLDSLADVISFGAAPAFLALALFKEGITLNQDLPSSLSRLIWAIGALFMSCAAMRLARFNVSNEHGEQHHFSFLGLPSPGAGGAVAGFILMQQELLRDKLPSLALICLWILPLVVLITGLLMVSNIRYPHLVNRYLRGRRSFGRLVPFVIIGLLLVVWPQYTIGVGTLAFALWGLVGVGMSKLRRWGKN
jgi:CDP-diacylglycerol--serine O-phosphatidyltransferase